jgi:hypothetical protein
VDDAAEQLVRLALAEKLAHRVYNSGGTTRATLDFAVIAKKYWGSRPTSTISRISFSAFCLVA